MERFSGWISVLRFADRGRRDSWDCWGCRDSRRRRERPNWSISFIWSIWSILLTGPENHQRNQTDQTDRIDLTDEQDSHSTRRDLPRGRGGTVAAVGEGGGHSTWRSSEKSGTRPVDLLCSRNARSRTPLVGRAQWEINQPPSLRGNEQAWRDHKWNKEWAQPTPCLEISARRLEMVPDTVSFSPILAKGRAL
jgi:hypothetical protein